MSLLTMGLDDATLELDEVTLHYVEAGEGPPVLLLHGFPEFWYSWRNQLPFLAEIGYRAIAPDLRGYNLSSRPKPIECYRTSRLVADVIGLIEKLFDTPPIIVGHDWGGIIAWRLAATHPERIHALVILNAPHPLAFQRELKRNPLQWLRSSYAGFFQLPWLPEKLLSAQRFAAIRQGLRSTSVNPAAFSSEDLEVYARAFEHGGIRGPLNYYRAARKFPSDLYHPPHKVEAKTLVIRGDQDPALDKGMCEGLDEWATNLEVVQIADASHWVHHDAPDRVNRLIKDFFSRL